MDLYFIDYDLIPLIIHDNYISCCKDLRSLVKTADHISFSDILDRRIRTTQNYSLLANKGIHSCIAPTYLIEGSVGFVKFPEYLIIIKIDGQVFNYSKSKKRIKRIKI